MGAGVEAAGPSPWIFAGWHAGAERDRADAHVIVIDVPAFIRGIERAAAGESGHDGIKAPPGVARKRIGFSKMISQS